MFIFSLKKDFIYSLCSLFEYFLHSKLKLHMFAPQCNIPSLHIIKRLDYFFYIVLVYWARLKDTANQKELTIYILQYSTYVSYHALPGALAKIDFWLPLVIEEVTSCSCHFPRVFITGLSAVNIIDCFVLKQFFIF